MAAVDWWVFFQIKKTIQDSLFCNISVHTIRLRNERHRSDLWKNLYWPAPLSEMVVSAQKVLILAKSVLFFYWFHLHCSRLILVQITTLKGVFHEGLSLTSSQYLSVNLKKIEHDNRLPFEEKKGREKQMTTHRAVDLRALLLIPFLKVTRECRV